MSPTFFSLGFVICWFHTKLSPSHFKTKLRLCCCYHSGLQQLFSVLLRSLLLFSLTTAQVRHMYYNIVCDVKKQNIFHNVITMDDLMNHSNRMYFSTTVAEI